MQNFPANWRKQGCFSVFAPNRLARIESFSMNQWVAPNPLQRLAGKKFSLLRGLAGKKQGMATVEPRAALEPPPAASFATEARTRKAHTTDQTASARVTSNEIMAHVVSGRYGNFADGEVCGVR
jgi:hypothetical protein